MMYENKHDNNFVFIRNEYNNTGGGCMVGSYYLYNRAKNRTEFLFVNEEGATLSTADYVMENIEFEDDMVIQNFGLEDFSDINKTVSEEFSTLLRMCFIDYVQKEHNRFGIIYGLPYSALTKELQDSITKEYKEWHEREQGYYFNTTGTIILINDLYEGDANNG